MRLSCGRHSQPSASTACYVVSIDGFVKSPSAIRQAHGPEQSRKAALRCILCHCSVLLCTPHSPGLRALHLNLFSLPSDSDFLRNHFYWFRQNVLAIIGDKSTRTNIRPLKMFWSASNLDQGFWVNEEISLALKGNDPPLFIVFQGLEDGIFYGYLRSQ